MSGLLTDWALGGAVSAIFGALGLWLVHGMRRAFRDMLAHLATLARLPDAVEDLSGEVRQAKDEIEQFSHRLAAVETLVSGRIDNIVIIGNERERI